MEYVIQRDELAHHGIKGQKWGVRRYENADGTLTEAGKIRYAKSQVAALKYKTAGERIKQIGKAGLAGAAAGAGFMLGATGQKGMDVLSSKGFSSNGLARIISEGLRQPGYDFKWVAVTGAITGLSSMAVSGLMQGASAINVKRGQKFVEQYKEAYKKTYGGQG